MKKTSVPFRIKNVFEGLAETNGILLLDEEMLKFQFQTKDSLLGVIKSDIKDLNINLSDVEEVDLKKSIFGNTLTIRVSKLNISNELPRQNLSEIKISIDKKHIEAALKLVSFIKL